jgi:nicotinamidase-related amidase
MEALLVIDMQRWMFRTPDRTVQLPALVAAINKLMGLFEAADRPIFDIRTLHKADRSTWSRLMLRHDYPCLIEGTPDAELVDGLHARGMPIVKRANDAFLGTDLEAQLRSRAVTKLVLAGVFIDGCVGLTAASAAQRGFEVSFADEAVGARDPVQAAQIRAWLTEMYELDVP